MCERERERGGGGREREGGGLGQRKELVMRSHKNKFTCGFESIFTRKLALHINKKRVLNKPKKTYTNNLLAAHKQRMTCLSAIWFPLWSLHLSSKNIILSPYRRDIYIRVLQAPLVLGEKKGNQIQYTCGILRTVTQCSHLTSPLHVHGGEWLEQPPYHQVSARTALRPCTCGTCT